MSVRSMTVDIDHWKHYWFVKHDLIKELVFKKPVSYVLASNATNQIHDFSIVKKKSETSKIPQNLFGEKREECQNFVMTYINFLSVAGADLDTVCSVIILCEGHHWGYFEGWGPQCPRVVWGHSAVGLHGWCHIHVPIGQCLRTVQVWGSLQHQMSHVVKKLFLVKTAVKHWS